MDRQTIKTTVSVGGSIGTAVYLNQIISWLVWRFFGIEIPNDISNAITGLLAHSFVSLLAFIERRYQVDLNGNGEIGNGDLAK